MKKEKNSLLFNIVNAIQTEKVERHSLMNELLLRCGLLSSPFWSASTILNIQGASFFVFTFFTSTPLSSERNIAFLWFLWVPPLVDKLAWQYAGHFCLHSCTPYSYSTASSIYPSKYVVNRTGIRQQFILCLTFRNTIVNIRFLFLFGLMPENTFWDQLTATLECFAHFHEKSVH